MINREPLFHLDTHRLNYLLGTYFLVCLPHLLRIPLWFGLYVITIIIWRYVIARKGMALPGILARVILISTGISMLLLTYGSFLGKHPGLALFICMLSLKLLEIRTKRDVLFLLFLNYFLILSHFLFSQSVGIALYAIIAALINTTVIIIVNRHHNDKTHDKKYARYFRLSVLMTVQALPLMLIMFILFPRLEGPLWELPNDSGNAKTGLSDSMSPGDISKLSRSTAIAFRVTFDSNPRSVKRLYWRGPVLNSFDGRVWRAAPVRAPYRPHLRLKGVSIHYTITLEAHNSRILPSLSFAHILPPKSRIDRQYVLHSRNEITNRLRYTVVSKTRSLINQVLDPTERAFYTHLPSGYNGRTRLLAQSILKKSHNDMSYSRNVLAFFKQGGYIYSMRPPSLGKHSIDEFLFKTRKGFCEHFASAYVALLRYGGVPARVVTGYQGADYNAIGKYYVVRQSNAHAWTEIWLKHIGWIRVDPTGTVTPDRIEKGTIGSLDVDANWNGNQYGKNSFSVKVSQYWDTLSNSWNQLILGYGENLQAALLSWFGIGSPGWIAKLLWLLGLSMLLILAIAIYYRFHKYTAKKDRIDLIFDSFCNKLKRQNLERKSWEGPDTYANRVIEKRSDLARDITYIINAYKVLRYAPSNKLETVSAFRTLVRHFKP